MISEHDRHGRPRAVASATELDEDDALIEAWLARHPGRTDGGHPAARPAPQDRLPAIGDRVADAWFR